MAHHTEGATMCECSDPLCTCAARCVLPACTDIFRGGVELAYCLQCAVEGVLRNVVTFTLRKEASFNG